MAVTSTANDGTVAGNTTNNVTLPGYIAPYANDLLARSQALTTQDPYHQYSGERVAGVSPLQDQAANSVAGLDAGNTMLQGQALTAQGANYTPQTGSFGLAAAQQYMNPYQQGVTDIAQREAVRQAGVQQSTNNGQAAQAGAFGGSRQGVVDAELQRNLQQHLGDIQTQGLNTSYQQAQAQYNADQTRQQNDAQFGAGAALKGGDSLTSAATKDFGMQSTAGMLDQQTQQNQDNTNYQDFLSNQQHPYNQLTFMKNMVSGFPGSSTSGTTTSTATPASNPISDAAGVIGIGNSVFGAGAGGTPSLWDQASNWMTSAAKGGAIQGSKVQSGLGHGRVAQLYGSLA